MSSATVIQIVDPSAIQIVGFASATNMQAPNLCGIDVVPPGTMHITIYNNAAVGVAATVSVGTVTTGEPGSDASITNSGTPIAAVLNFSIPRGEQGEQGEQGDQGDQGVASASSPITYDSGTKTIGFDQAAEDQHNDARYDASGSASTAQNNAESYADRALASESLARSNADTALGESISAETARATDAEVALQNNINSEAESRVLADAATLSSAEAFSANANNLSSGTVPTAQIPAIALAMMASLAANSVIGNLTGSNVAPVAVPASSAATPASVTTRDSNGNTAVNNLYEGFLSTTTSAVALVLTNASTFFQYFIGTASQTVYLPAANTMAKGAGFWFLNNSSGVVSIVNVYSGVTLVNIPANTQVYVFATSIGNQTGAWLPFAADESATTVGKLIAGSVSKPSPVDADLFAISDSAASNVLKSLSGANLKNYLAAYLNTLYQQIFIDTDNFINCVANYPPASNSGRRYRVTDVGIDGSDWVSDGANLRLLSAKILHTRITAPWLLAQSGTISTGASNNFTLGSALNTTFTAGVWIYLPATTTCTPNIAAGWYWCVMSTATVSTIYTAGPGSAAFNFSIGGAMTGDASGSLRNILSAGIPANAFGLTGGLDVMIRASMINNGNGKSIYVYLNSSVLSSTSVSSGASLDVDQAVFRNINSASVQRGTSKLGTSSGSNTPKYAAENTSVFSTAYVSMSKSVATDWVLIECAELTFVGA